MKKMNHERLLAFFAITATTVFWGLSYICAKSLLIVFTPFQVAASRYLITVLIMMAGGFITHRLRPISRHDLPRLFAAGFIGIFIYFILENSGLRLTTAGMASLIIAIIPVLNTIIVSIFLRQHTSLSVWVGVTFSVVGVAVVIGGAEFSINSIWGNLMILGAAFAWVGYTLLNQPLSQKYDAFSINTYQAANCRRSIKKARRLWLSEQRRVLSFNRASHRPIISFHWYQAAWGSASIAT
jgi:drug/metabolite transporter (DMT)-like permease